MVLIWINTFSFLFLLFFYVDWTGPEISLETIQLQSPRFNYRIISNPIKKTHRRRVFPKCVTSWDSFILWQRGKWNIAWVTPRSSCLALFTTFTSDQLDVAHLLTVPSVALGQLHVAHLLTVPSVTLGQLHVAHLLTVPSVTLGQLHVAHLLTIPSVTL